MYCSLLSIHFLFLYISGIALLAGLILFYVFHKFSGKNRSLLNSLKALENEKRELENLNAQQREQIVIQNREIKIREREESEHLWFNGGLAKFNEILSRNKENIEKLCQELIKNIVNYTGGVQGGIFLLQDKEVKPFLELISVHGGSADFKNKRFMPGEGEVGSCFLEAETRLYTEISPNYITPVSSAGECDGGVPSVSRYHELRSVKGKTGRGTEPLGLRAEAA